MEQASVSVFEALFSFASRRARRPPPRFYPPPPPEPDVDRFFRTADPGFPDLRSLLPADARVLDVGCGVGRNLSELSKQGFRPLGLDLSLLVLDEARALSDIPLLRGDLFELPFRENSFDAVVAWQVVCHFDPGSRRAALRQLARLVVPGGLVVASSCPESAPIETSALPAGFETVELRGLAPTPDCPWERWMLIARRR
jgi:SAM-dependent methyltransferase